jgi:hypothetical protein
MASTSRGSIPAQALNKGGLNETTPAEQRRPATAEDLKDLDDGPNVGERRTVQDEQGRDVLLPGGDYLPAKYKLNPGEKTPKRRAVRIDR